MRDGELRDEMAVLVDRATAFVKARLRAGGKEIHLGVCTHFADKYSLWDDEQRFPLWLSRVIEGVIRDVEEGQA